MDVSTKLLTMVIAILLFVAVVGLMLFIASWTERRSASIVGYVFLFPSILMVSVGLALRRG